MTLSRLLLTIASSDDSTIAARRSAVMSSTSVAGRSARVSGFGALIVQEPGSEHVGGVALHPRVQVADGPKRRRGAAAGEVRGRIAAEEREWMLRPQLVPELLELARGLEISFLSQDLDQLAVDAQAGAGARSGEPRD